jgi:hypothetical protein
MRFTRPRLALLVIVGLIVAYEGYAFFIKNEGEPGFMPSAAHTFLTSEVAGGAPLAVEFAMHAEGLEAIELYPHSSYEPPEGTVTFTFIDQIYIAGTMRESVPIAHSRAPATEVAATRPYRLRLPRIDRSAGHRYRLEIAVEEARPQHGLRFEAGWPGTEDARLLVGSREEWGDLKFQTVAERTTIARTVARLRRTAPPIVQSSLFWIALLLLFNWALFVIIRDLALPPAE